MPPASALSYQCVVLAGGDDRRLHPLTASSVKALMPVANRPLISYTLKALADAGQTKVFVVSAYGLYKRGRALPSAAVAWKRTPPAVRGRRISHRACSTKKAAPALLGSQVVIGEEAAKAVQEWAAKEYPPSSRMQCEVRYTARKLTARRLASYSTRHQPPASQVLRGVA